MQPDDPSTSRRSSIHSASIIVTAQRCSFGTREAVVLNALGRS